MVGSAGSGLCFLQNSEKIYATNGVSLANGIADIRPHVPFKVRVINTFDRPHTLQKGMVLGWTLPHPMQILTVPTGDDRKDGNIIDRGAPENSRAPEIEKEEIEKMLAQGVIEPATVSGLPPS
jgi:hypothetical protein